MLGLSGVLHVLHLLIFPEPRLQERGAESPEMPVLANTPQLTKSSTRRQCFCLQNPELVGGLAMVALIFFLCLFRNTLIIIFGKIGNCIDSKLKSLISDKSALVVLRTVDVTFLPVRSQTSHLTLLERRGQEPGMHTSLRLP